MLHVATNSLLVEIYALAFTTAGVVTSEAAVAPTPSTATATGSVASATKTNSGSGKLVDPSLWKSLGIAAVVEIFYYLAL
jgi:hypothetical protein